MIPPALTEGKSSVTIRIENVSGSSDWTEYRYRVYSFLPVLPSVSADPDPGAGTPGSDDNGCGAGSGGGSAAGAFVVACALLRRRCKMSAGPV